MSTNALTLTLPISAPIPEPLTLDPTAPQWAQAPILTIEHPAGPPPHAGDGFFPEVCARILATPNELRLLFTVHNEHGVQATEHHRNGKVWLDSTVEFFVRPEGEKRYLNLEINCLGIPHASRVTDWVRDPVTNAVRDRWILPDALLDRIDIIHSIDDLPRTRTGLPTPSSWSLAYRLPIDVLTDIFEHPLPYAPGALWHANFYKCADGSRHPHWLSWSPMPRLQFHDPDNFGQILFA